MVARLQPELAALLDSWRREQPGLPSRPEAIRRLVELGQNCSPEAFRLLETTTRGLRAIIRRGNDQARRINIVRLADLVYPPAASQNEAFNEVRIVTDLNIWRRLDYPRRYPRKP